LWTETTVPGGAPEGNQNSSLEKRAFSNVVRRVGIQKEGERLRKVVEALYDKAESGDVGAAREIADRFEGKAAQQLIHSGDEDNPVRYQTIERIIVDSPKTKDA